MEIIRLDLIVIGVAAGALLYVVPYISSYGISKLFKLW